MPSSSEPHTEQCVCCDGGFHQCECGSLMNGIDVCYCDICEKCGAGAWCKECDCQNEEEWAAMEEAISKDEIEEFIILADGTRMWTFTSGCSLREDAKYLARGKQAELIEQHPEFDGWKKAK